MRGLLVRATLMSRASHTCVDQPGEEAGIDDEIAPFGVKRSGWPGGNRFVPRSALLFERRNILANRYQHVAKLLELSTVADRCSMPRNDDRLVGGRREIGVGCRDHAVNAAAGGMVDERIDAVPVSVGDMHDVG